MTTILLIRHGMTDAVGRRIAGWDPGVLLNERGLEQVERLGRELAAVKFDAIISSPLERAAMTAAAIAKHHRLTVSYREGLGEVRFGEWTGLTLDQLERDGRWKLWCTMRASERAPGGVNEGIRLGALGQVTIGSGFQGLGDHGRIVVHREYQHLQVALTRFHSGQGFQASPSRHGQVEHQHIGLMA